MAEVRVRDRSGAELTLDASNGRQLMEALRDANLNVAGTCGGACACGTCHVYIASTWAARLPAKTEDEQMMLDALAELIEVRPESRLSCQITVDDSLKGLELEIGPVA